MRSSPYGTTGAPHTARMPIGTLATMSSSEERWSDDLIGLVRRTGTLCLNVDDPGWDDARGYLFDDATTTMYFPVAKKYLAGDPARYQVLIWSQPKVVVTGELLPAQSDEDAATQLALAENGGKSPEKARFMILDKRTMKPRKTRYKLLVRDIALLNVE